jgi:hypothetical protein
VLYFRETRPCSGATNKPPYFGTSRAGRKLRHFADEPHIEPVTDSSFIRLCQLWNE